MSIFLGWMPGDAALPAFAALQRALSERLPADAPRHNWRNPRQWHMTIRHLGDSLDHGMQARIDAQIAPLAARTQAIDGHLDGIQYWPHVSVLVVRIQAAPALLACFSAVDTAMTALGFSADRRKPQPHATLAYLPRGATPPALPAPALEEASQPISIDRLQLLRTAPGRYEVLASWPLQSNPTAG